MRRISLLIVVACVWLAGAPALRTDAAANRPVASGTSDWPALNADAAQSNYNRAERTITASNALKLKVRWTTRITAQSYPIVAGGRVYVPVTAGAKIHVRAIDAATGKKVATYTKDGLGGLLLANGNLYLAGHVLQAVDPATGNKLFQIDGSPKLPGSTFLYPEADTKYVFAGFASGVNSSIYSVDATSNQVVQKLPSSSAAVTVTAGHVLTISGATSIFYDEATGHALARPAYLGSYWFAGPNLAYTAAAVKKHGTQLIALDGIGHKIWSHVIGPILATGGSDWPHAVSTQGVYVQSFKPSEGITALDPLSGQVLWTRALPNVQRIVLANKLLFVLTYALGAPVRLVILRAGTGKPVGAIALEPGFSYFGAFNGLMVADGMVFIRAVDPTQRPELIALGLP